jgi:hypothetical protein
LIEGGEAILIGPVRQEIISGIRVPEHFDRLRIALMAFDDEPIRTEDHENAARMFNICRSLGVQGSNTDFLICALAARLSAPVFTLDRDLDSLARFLPIRLYRATPTRDSGT